MKKVYLQAGNSNVNRSPAELLEEAAKKIEAQRYSQLSYLFLDPSPSADTYPTLEIEVWPLTEKEKNESNDSIELMFNEEYTDPASFQQKTVIDEDVKLLEVWNSMKKSDIHNVGNLAMLLRRARDELQKLGQVEIIDMIVHDFTDDDALLRPYIRIYYTKQQG